MQNIINDPARVDHVIDAVRAMLPDLEIVRDIEAGYSRVRGRATKYLPRHPAETIENYSIRLERPAFFNSFARTTGGLTGMVFRRNPVLGEDVPEIIRTDHWENIDYAGTHGDVFGKTVFHDALVAGHCGILVDFPDVGEKQSRAEEKRRGLRPYWSHYQKEDILSWRVRVIDGRTVLTQLVLREQVYKDAGKFGLESIPRYRVLYNIEGAISWEAWEPDTRPDVPKLVNKGELRGVTEIPFVVVYANRTAFMQSKPSLIDLAWLNIAYYQTNSDKLNAEHIANTPIPVLINVDTDGEKVEFGPNTVLELPEGADAKWMETKGTAIGESRQTLSEMRAEMSVLGLGILERRPMTAETATAKRIDRSEKDSQLSAAARSLEDGLEQCLLYHVQFMGEKDGGSVTLNRDYQELSLTPEQIRVYLDLVKEGQLSVLTLWDILEEGNALPASFNPKEELARVVKTEPKEPKGDNDEPVDPDLGE